MFLLLFITLILYSCHGQEQQQSIFKPGWKPSQPPFRPADSCGEDESVCNLNGYDSDNGITNIWQPHYFGCVEEGKEGQCCPPGWKYNNNSFYMETAPENTCIIGDEIFEGKTVIHENRKFCEGKSNVSCRVKATRDDRKGESIVHYKHICQDKSSPCNEECYEGYEKKYNFKDNVLECQLSKKGRDSEEDDNDDDGDDDDEDNKNDDPTHTTPKPITIKSNDTENKFHDTTEGMIVFSLVGVVVMAAIATVITVVLLHNKKKKEKVEFVEANPDYGLADDEDNIEFRDTNIDYFLPNDDGDIEVVDYNDEYGRASVDDRIK